MTCLRCFKPPVMHTLLAMCVDIRRLISIVKRFAGWLPIRYQAPAESCCRVFPQANFESLVGMQVYFLPVSAFVKLLHGVVLLIILPMRCPLRCQYSIDG